MEVNLPQKDSPEDQEKRTAWLERNRTRYEFNPDYLPPLTVIKDVPDNESFSARYLAERLPATLGKLAANTLAVNVRSLWDPLDELQDFEDFYQKISPPSVMPTYQTDECFAEQRLSGANPIVLQRLQSLPPTLTYNLTDLQAAYGSALNLEKELKEGNLYVADYTQLAFVQGGTYLKGKKYLPAPIALFCWRGTGYGTRGELVPIAIQIAPHLGKESSLLTPFSPAMNWLYAKTCVQIADANHHEMATHLCYTHFVMEPFAIVTARQLFPTHPLSILLTPHFRFMLYNNELARERLVNQGGIVDDLLAGTLRESLQIVQQAYFTNAQNYWSLDKFALPTEIKNRGLDDQEALPHYPYRDDGLLLWEAIERYVTNYLKLYYTSAEELQEDYELQAWAGELTDQSGGKVKGMPSKINTTEELIAIVTSVIFTCGPQHSAVNFTQYDYLGFIPNAPLAAYQPIKNQFSHSENSLTLQELMAFLPPPNQVMGQIQILYALSAYRYDRLGYYDTPFPDRRAQVVLTRFQQELQTIERKIELRNKNRVTPYKVLRPSLVLNSISI
ncbi:MAG: lipoxygenase [Gomphosphaeria aponina SAG 52.96 = DSM 107014]|uniref:Lipoxygenase n=1 Tax=Gomphosphaeria aponina SAG 52.96 = DSM 107014 TaxID=1521640 RepID=A0A941JR89_9CHRO|nr:lipoxygenase [Gomphosphaeria aponina SAG 52.96 = DSM 107014]